MENTTTKRYIADPHTKTAVRMLPSEDLDALIDQNSKWADEAEKELERRDSDAHDPHLDDEPDTDDSVRFCPECETPNQFGETCNRCLTEIEQESFC